MEKIRHSLRAIQGTFTDNPFLIILFVGCAIALLIVVIILLDALLVKLKAALQLKREKARAISRSKGQWPLAR